MDSKQTLEIARSLPKEEGRDIIRNKAMEIRASGEVHALHDATQLMHDYAHHLLEQGHFGWATDIIREAANWCKEEGKLRRAAVLLASLGNLFLDARTRLYGWAADNYYDAAMCYIEEGDVDKAKKLLKAAYDSHFSKTNDPRSAWLKKHLDILEKPSPEVDRLDELSFEFKLSNRDNWFKSCKKGISVILNKLSTSQESTLDG